ncbi:hypothetical protein C1H76_5446 [Elsinoe australis]|uniref:Uncharacterized protein n=1 Tax=Elsinoe australis TaxID=40998 RepID=A0A4U7AV33_9PEZI|nr:hypothetical protein C1H76_5446 [Elsinoe australis]
MAYYPPYDHYYSPPHLSPQPYAPYYRSSSHGRGHENTTNVFVPTSPDYRGRQIERIADEIQDLRISQSRGRYRAHSDLVYARSRSRSRSSSHLEREIERLKKDLEASEGRHHEDEHKHQIISQWENEQAEKKRKKEEEIKRVKEQIRVDEIMAKEKADKQYKEFEALQEKKKQEAELKAKQEKEKADKATRANLAKAGYSENQIDRIMARASDEHKEQTTIESKTTNIIAYPGGGQPTHVHHHSGHHNHHSAGDIIVAGSGRTPVFPRAHRHDISTDVLKEFGISYRYDPVDSNYIIIYREMDQAMFEVLHDKTKEQRGRGKKKYLIEAKKDRGGGLAIVRKKDSRSRSRSRNRGSEKIVYVRGI